MYLFGRPARSNHCRGIAISISHTSTGMTSIVASSCGTGGLRGRIGSLRLAGALSDLSLFASYLPHVGSMLAKRYQNIVTALITFLKQRLSETPKRSTLFLAGDMNAHKCAGCWSLPIAELEDAFCRADAGRARTNVRS